MRFKNVLGYFLSTPWCFRSWLSTARYSARLLVIPVFTMFFFSSCSGDLGGTGSGTGTDTNAATAQIDFTNVWVRSTVPSAQVNAGYFTMRNNSSRDLKVARLEAGGFGLVEAHEMVQEDGMMSMRRIDELVIPAQGTLELKPGGKHLMLMKREIPVNEGDEIPLTIYFESGETLELLATVKK